MMYSELPLYKGVGLIFIDPITKNPLMPPTIPEDKENGKKEAVLHVSGASYQDILEGSVGEAPLGMIGGKVDVDEQGRLEALSETLAREWLEEMLEILETCQFHTLAADVQARIMSFIHEVSDKIRATEPEAFTYLDDLRVLQWRELMQEDGTLTKEIRGMLTVSILSMDFPNTTEDSRMLQLLGFKEVDKQTIQLLRPYAQVVINQLGYL